MVCETTDRIVQQRKQSLRGELPSTAGFLASLFLSLEYTTTTMITLLSRRTLWCGTTDRSCTGKRELTAAVQCVCPACTTATHFPLRRPRSRQCACIGASPPCRRSVFPHILCSHTRTQHRAHTRTQHRAKNHSLLPATNEQQRRPPP